MTDYGFTSNGGSVFLNAMNISPADATSFGALPDSKITIDNGKITSGNMNSKYWKKIYTDRDVKAGIQLPNDGSFFIAGTFSGKDTSYSQNNKDSITGNDIYKSITIGQIAFDEYGNIRLTDGATPKNWKNPLTTIAMDSRYPIMTSLNMPNPAFIISANGKWILAQDTELSTKSSDKTYYVLFNPIHSAPDSSKAGSDNTATFKKWYGGQVDSNGNRIVTGNVGNRIKEPLVQKYCEMVAQKEGNTYKTSKIPFNTSYDGSFTLQTGDGQRNYADPSCYIVTPKEGAFNVIGGVFNPSKVPAALFAQAVQQSICSNAVGPIKDARSNKPNSFISDYITDMIDVTYGDPGKNQKGVCPASQNTFCTSVVQAAGNISVTGGSSVGNQCGLPMPTVPPPPPPTLAPTAAPTLAPTAAPTMAPTAAPTMAATAAPTMRPTMGPTAAPTMAAVNKLVPTYAPTMSPTTAPVQSSNTTMIAIGAAVIIVGVAIVFMKK